MPVFWLGLHPPDDFAVELGWLPVSGTHTVGTVVASRPPRAPGAARDRARLPLRRGAGRATSARACSACCGADYVRTARAKGLPESAGHRRPRPAQRPHPVVSIMALEPRRPLLGRGDHRDRSSRGRGSAGSSCRPCSPATTRAHGRPAHGLAHRHRLQPRSPTSSTASSIRGSAMSERSRCAPLLWRRFPRHQAAIVSLAVLRRDRRRLRPGAADRALFLRRHRPRQREARRPRSRTGWAPTTSAATSSRACSSAGGCPSSSAFWPRWWGRSLGTAIGAAAGYHGGVDRQPPDADHRRRLRDSDPARCSSS